MPLTERQLEVKRKYREANREKVRSGERERQRIKRQMYPEKYILSNAKNRARREGFPCTIVLEDIVVPDICPILGIPLAFNFGGKSISDNSPSLDKIVPELGYVPGNIRIISHRANRLKSNLTIDEILKLAAYIRGEL